MTWIESFKMAVSAIGSHKLRSILTLIGIIAGVAAIISVMTGVSVVQSEMEAELSVLSNRTFQVMKFPMGGFNNNRNVNFREIARWPPLTMAHVHALRQEFKGWNSAAWDSNEFKKIEKDIDKLIEEKCKESTQTLSA